MSVLLDDTYMNYDDHHYSETNPETLSYQDPAEVILTIWAALRPCREITGPDNNRDRNNWITWVPPKRFNPDCGMRAFEPGRWWGKRMFAEVSLNIIGDDYEISVWRARHEGVVVFSTRDDGPVLSPTARLNAAVSQMMDLTTKFDGWTRNGTLREEFPKEWIGKNWLDLLKMYVISKFMLESSVEATWPEVMRSLSAQLFVRDKDSISQRHKVWMSKHPRVSSQIGIAIVLTTSISFALLAVLAFLILFYLGNYAITNQFFWTELHESIRATWDAVVNPLQYRDRWGDFELRDWAYGFLSFPEYVFVNLLIPIGLVFAGLLALVPAARNAIAIFRYALFKI